MSALIGRAGNRHHFTGNHYLNRTIGNCGVREQRAMETDAEIGSRELRDEIHSLFRNWEIENGFVEGAGQILLPAGWSVK